MAWSIFSNGGGDGAALTWAQDFLQALGAPNTPGNQQFVYDWEMSEGGGGKYNPLNQGPVPGHPELTSTGSQYGGGAADYVSYGAGIQGAVDFLNMSNYAQVKASLMANDPNGARSALIQSPWAASHYGYGSSFSNAPLPGQATSLLSTGGSVVNASGTTGTVENASANLFAAIPGWMKSFVGSFFPNTSDFADWASEFKFIIERAALVIFGAALILVGANKVTNGSISNGAKKVAGSVPPLA